MEENNLQNEQGEELEKNTTKTYFYAGIASAALGLIAFGLAFSVLGIYSLIGAIIFEIAALRFFEVQKKKNNFKAVYVLKVVSYSLLAAFALFFIGGIIYSSVK